MPPTPTPEEHFRKLENMYHGAPINHAIPSRMVVSEGCAEVTMNVSKDYWHSGHAMHGSMYFKGLDDAAFFAANSVVEEFLVLTVKFEVELLGMVRCHSLKAKGFLDKRENRKIWARSELYDDGDTLVAKGSGLFLVSKLPLHGTTGYETA